nr:RNA-directed DNA polymerase, eukaryota [Tanacetum cinerariifolium]
GIYKVVTKILANRLAMVISDIVSNNQSAFIAGRHILDGPFIINEILDWCKRRCKKVMFFKVDFVKAYDSVRWEYLIDVLKAFGFGLNWCQWIQGTFCFAKASILVNGSPTNEFQFHRGLKQGDPLASLLFILVMESLHLSFNRVVDAGILKEMESIRNNFFIGAGPSEKNITWVAWNQVLASKEKGGLGVSSFFALNRALLLKWVWRFVSQDGSLWYHVIQAIYGVKINSHPVRYNRWVCNVAGNGNFSVKIIRDLIDDLILPSSVVSTRWVKSVPIKINIFMWRARRDCLPTRLNLSHRGVIMETVNCPTCGFKDILEGVFYVMWWVIWKYRNQTLFGSSQRRMDMLFDEIVLLSFTWCSNRCKNNFDWISWMKYPRSLAL